MVWGQNKKGITCPSFKATTENNDYILLINTKLSIATTKAKTAIIKIYFQLVLPCVINMIAMLFNYITKIRN